jgi:hypothetical protein
LIVWHHGSPNRDVLSTPDPPIWNGRYHREGGRATWYGASSEGDAWAELLRSLPDEIDPSEFPRRLGRVEFELLVLDLTSRDLQTRLKISNTDLTADDLAVCETLADIAAQAGFDAVLGPSAASAADQTLAVFGPAISSKSRDVRDLGVQTPPRS